MTRIADAGFWIAVVLTGLTVGLLASRWDDRGAPSRRIEGLLLAVAAAGVIAWCSNAGVLLGGFASSSSELLTAFVPIDVGAAYRLAVLWATIPGATLTFAVVLLVWTALSGPGTRVACLTSGLALAALGLSAWFAPRGAGATTIPPFVQSAPAALAPLFALFTLMVLAPVAAYAIAERGPAPRNLLLVAWLAATAAVTSEQAARSQLGIGQRDAVVLGSASSGLILWLASSVLLHRRVQSLFFSVRPRVVMPDRWLRYASLTGHIGAAFVAISFAAHGVASRTTVVLPPGTSVSVTDAFRQPWQLVNQGVSRFDATGFDVTALAVEARHPRGGIELLTPEIREYHGRGGQHLDAVSLRRSTGNTTQAFRVLFMGADSLDVASVRVTFLPVPILWPAGVVLLVLSAGFALLAPSSNHPPDELTK